MINVYNMERLFGVDELFVLMNSNNKIGLIVAKVVEDFFLSGIGVEIRRFHEYVNRSLKLSAPSIYSNLNFLGCDIKVYTEGDAPGPV